MGVVLRKCLLVFVIIGPATFLPGACKQLLFLGRLILPACVNCWEGLGSPSNIHLAANSNLEHFAFKHISVLGI